MNYEGPITVKATSTGADSTLAGIGRLVADAQGREAPVQRLADSVAGKFCWTIMAASAATFSFWAAAGGPLSCNQAAAWQSPGGPAKNLPAWDDVTGCQTAALVKADLPVSYSLYRLCPSTLPSALALVSAPSVPLQAAPSSPQSSRQQACQAATQQSCWD